MAVPLTLPTDSSGEPERVYGTLRALAERIIERRGVVVITLHPQPHQSGKPAHLRAYSDFLEDLEARHGNVLWHATPAEIAARYRDAILEARPPAPERAPEPVPQQLPEPEPRPDPEQLAQSSAAPPLETTPPDEESIPKEGRREEPAS